MTAEQYGIISGLIMIHICFLKYELRSGRYTITIWVDNEEALRRISSDATDDVRLKAHGVRDYGYLLLMQHLRDCLPSNVKLSWNKVKIHQHGPLEDQPFEAQLNDAADQMAGQICTRYH